MEEDTYKIVRFFFKGGRQIIKEGLTRIEAAEHCGDPETASDTCSEETRQAVGTTDKWFDGFEKE